MRLKAFRYLAYMPLILLAGCAAGTDLPAVVGGADGKYDSGFPHGNSGPQLAAVAASIQKVDVLVFYNTFEFPSGSRLSLDSIRSSKSNLSNLALNTNVFSEAAGGTTLLIYTGADRIALLGCAHVVDFPDTLVSYHPPPDDQFVSAIGLKVRQQINASGIRGGSELEVLAIDSKDDIVLLGKTMEAGTTHEYTAFSYPLGKSEELEWGNFVYVLGFPMGQRMVGHGIVSDPARIGKGTFLIDAVFNEGYSGAPLIAIRDGLPNFEMVGMVRSAAATERIYLLPEYDPSKGEHIPGIPYHGTITTAKEKNIRYGITFSTTTASLRKFYSQHRDHLISKGYYLDEFFSVAQ
jgi:hypothetical protein